MSLTIGRKGWISLGKETTPGAPVAPTVYLPFVEQSVNGRHEPIADMAAKGIREDQYGSVQGKKWGEGSFSVNVEESKVGHLFYMIFGSLSTATVAGAVKDHTFSRNNSNTPQTYTVIVDRVQDRNFYNYCVAKSGELTFADGLVTLKVDMISRAPIATTSGTLTVVSGTLYAWKDATVKFGTTLATAVTATPTQVSEFTINWDNVSEASFRSGVQEPASIDHGPFKVSGSFKLFFEGTTQMDAYMALTKQACIVTITGRGIGGGYSESITINISKMRFADAVVETPLDGMSAVTCQFIGEYDPDNTKSCDLVLRNVTASY